jgi:hypothetical protein
VLNIFAKDLQNTGIIHIGRAKARDPLFSRVLHLIKDPTIRRLVRHEAAATRLKSPAPRSAVEG